MKSFDMRAFRRYLKAESMSRNSINKFTHYLEDFLMYGKRKPYMPTKTYNKLLDKEVKYLESLQYNLNNAFIVRIESNREFSWQNIKNKLQYFLNGVKRFLNDFDYYIWFRTFNDLNYEIYVCFDFKDNNVKKQHVEYVVKDQWYDCATCNVISESSITFLAGFIKYMKDDSLQEDKSLTWFLDKAKIFMHSPTFGIDRNKISISNSKLDMIQSFIDDEQEYQKQLALEDDYYINYGIQPLPIEEIF